MPSICSGPVELPVLRTFKSVLIRNGTHESLACELDTLPLCHTAVTDQVYRKDDQERVYRYCKFYDPKSKGFILRRGHFSRIVKMQYFFENLLYPYHESDKLSIK